MGHIKKLLAVKEIEPRSITPNTVWTDLCENVHLHHRNVRFDMSERDWAHLRAAITTCGVAIEKVAEEKNYREGNPVFLVQQIFNEPVPSDSDYYPNRVCIELNQDNTVHFHYRNIRLHWSLREFEAIASMFKTGVETYVSYKPFPYRDIEKPVRDWVDIDLIQPYDESHRPGVIDASHIAGIEYCKKLMSKPSNKIRPILVSHLGQRLDGFKRYMSAKQLGNKEIECIIDPYGIPGGQHNQSMLDDKEE